VVSSNYGGAVMYRISVWNVTTGRRELMWNIFTNKKKAQEFADKLNSISNTADAQVIKK